MSDRFSVECRVGRLVEARVSTLRDVEDADEYSAALGAMVQEKAGNTLPVLCADHRPVVIYPQPVTDRLVELFTRMNAQLERVAILVAKSNATLTLQLNRIVREAGYENRQVFLDAGDALDFLAPGLTQEELERARAFLVEFRPSE
jgi:hypothetical protein